MRRKRLRPADKAWLTLVAAIVVYELAARDGELLSDGVQRYMARQPWLVRAVIAVTAAHLMNALPRRLDPYQGCHRITLHYRKRPL
ncbi:DUF7427 family protein [Mycobacterium celatum]|uniref:DUF7427 family protein n=1 Tax=Mycobacterium celatum TaxID=28045 RepID=UPI001930F08C|nr:hypothetical protein [Mycobacterium celatum]